MSGILKTLIVSLVSLSAFSVLLLGWADTSRAQQTAAPACPVSSLVSGPVQQGDNYVYTFGVGDLGNPSGTETDCFWKINSEEMHNCASFTKSFPKDSGLIGVSVEIKAKAAGSDDWSTFCKQTDTFQAGDKRRTVTRQLEVSYPILKLPGGEDVTVSTRTTPAQYIRYAFILALTVLGLVAFLSLLFAGTQWLIGQREQAGRRLLGVATGIAVLLASYLVLNFINPELVKLKDPELPVLNQTLPNIDYAAFQICQKARQNSTPLSCKDFSNLSPDSCLVNPCPDITQGLPCAYGSTFIRPVLPINIRVGGGGCYSFASRCEKNGGDIKSCPDYYKLNSLFGEDGKFVCDHDPCGVSQTGCTIKYGLLGYTSGCFPK